MKLGKVGAMLSLAAMVFVSLFIYHYMILLHYFFKLVSAIDGQIVFSSHPSFLDIVFSSNIVNRTSRNTDIMVAKKKISVWLTVL